MANGVLAILEWKDGEVAGPGLETLGEARRLADALGGPCRAALIGGDGAAGAAAGLGAAGADEVLVIEHADLARYSNDGWGAAAAAAVEKTDAAVILLSAAGSGRDLGPQTAARTGAAYLADCTATEAGDGTVTFRRPVYAGKAVLTARGRTERTVATLRPNAFARAEGSGDAETTTLDAPVTGDDIRDRVTDVEEVAGERPELTEAAIVVSGGRGLKDPENWHLVENLADTLGAAIGASRAVVDAGWRPHEEQVGQTGKTVSPALYIAIAISGAIQHLAGMSSSGVIVAINKDPEAPIFKVADYGIVGDAFEVVPALTEALASGD